MVYFTNKTPKNLALMSGQHLYLAPGNVDWDTDLVTATPWTLTPDPSITQLWHIPSGRHSPTWASWTSTEFVCKVTIETNTVTAASQVHRKRSACVSLKKRRVIQLEYIKWARLWRFSFRGTAVKVHGGRYQSAVSILQLIFLIRKISV